MYVYISGPYSFYVMYHFFQYYEIATISRLLKIIGLFCRIKSLLQGAFAKETYNFKEPTNRSHPIPTTTSHPHPRATVAISWFL